MRVSEREITQKVELRQGGMGVKKEKSQRMKTHVKKKEREKRKITHRKK